MLFSPFYFEERNGRRDHGALIRCGFGSDMQEIPKPASVEHKDDGDHLSD